MARWTIVQTVDKCLKCRACMVACERVNKLDADGTAEAVSYDDLVAVKSQNVNLDMGPYVRYNCWHCPNPPCANACPWGAFYEHTDSNGDVLGVDIDRTYCHAGESGTLSKRGGGTATGTCTYQCRRECGRGGYPKIGNNNSYLTSGTKAYKCTLCATKIAAGDLTRPACVTACPNAALKYGKLNSTKTTLYVDGVNDVATNVDLDGSARPYQASNGGFFWISKKHFIPPTADPFVEDHLTPMMSKFLLSPAAAGLLMPAAVIGGLYGVIRRRMSVQNA